MRYDQRLRKSMLSNIAHIKALTLKDVGHEKLTEVMEFFSALENEVRDSYEGSRSDIDDLR